jgi:hypothetical protein
MSEQEWLEKLEQYAEDTLPLQDRTELQWRLNSDEVCSKKAKEHLDFLTSLKSFDLRKKLKAELEGFQLSMEAEPITYEAPHKEAKQIGAWNK